MTAREPLDDVDQELLDRVAAIHLRLDPVPMDLTDRIAFAMDLGELDLEVARSAGELLAGAGARAGEPDGTWTFETESWTVLLTATRRADRQIRLDGWLSPPAGCRVELRIADPAGSRLTEPDEQGRFAIDGLSAGTVQLVLHPSPGAGRAATVTPAFTL